MNEMKIVDKRSQSEDSPIKTVQEHIRSFDPTQDIEDEVRSLVLHVFDTCITIAEREAHDEAMRLRYQGESLRGAQRMAESIAKQLKDLRGTK